MTEEQKLKKIKYMKTYWENNKEKAKEIRKRWYISHKQQQLENNKKIYQRQKENGTTWQQRNKDKVKINQQKYINKKLEELRAQGITNPWAVIQHKGEPKYENNK